MSRTLTILIIGAALLAVAALVFGQNTALNPNLNRDLGYTDTPMLPGLPYHVHDPARPHPGVITPAAQVGGAPSDAIVLFDGKDLSHWESRRRNGKSWSAGNGYFEV